MDSKVLKKLNKSKKLAKMYDVFLASGSLSD